MPEELKVDPDKYLVANRQELYEAIILGLDQPIADKVLDLLARHAIDDGFVLRQQDWLAVGGLYGYANHVRTVLEVIREFGDPFSQAAIPNLEAIADYAMSLANGCEDVQRKLPTL